MIRKKGKKFVVKTSDTEVSLSSSTSESEVKEHIEAKLFSS